MHHGENKDMHDCMIGVSFSRRWCVRLSRRSSVALLVWLDVHRRLCWPVGPGGFDPEGVVI